ncbi:MAG: universal stress protein [Thermoleophilia bacterium]|nr:universal stress protein [Thermoleophilia bacterium]
MKGYRNLLVTADSSQGALREGLRLAGEENCWVTVLKVVPPYEGDIDLTGVRNIREVLTSDRAGEWRTWQRHLREEAAARVRVEQGDLPETINRVAEEEGCDLIIMGVKKRGGWLHRLFEGNLVHRVARGAPCSVMVVDA